MTSTTGGRRPGTPRSGSWVSSMTTFITGTNERPAGAANEEENDEEEVLGPDRAMVSENPKRRRRCCGISEPLDEEKTRLRREQKPWKRNYVNAGLISRFLFSWCSSLVHETLEREIDVEDLWDLRDEQQTSLLADRVRTAWEYECERAERKEKKPSLFKGLLRAFKREICWVAVFKSLWLVSILLTNALFFNSTLRVLQNFANNQTSVPTVTTSTGLVIPYTGLFWALAFGLSDICRSIFINAHWWTASITGLKARVATATVVFDKLAESRQVSSVGAVVTHSTSDVHRIMDAFTYGIFIFSTPIALICIVIVGSLYLSGAFAVGLALLILFLPVQVRISSKSQEFHQRAVKVSSERVTLVSEILRAVKLVKLYGWDVSFSNKVNAVREVEMRALVRGATVKASNQALSFTTPALVVAASFAVHTLALKRPLLASEAFTAVALLNAARFPLSILPNSTRCLSECMVACRRLEKFLLQKNAAEFAFESGGKWIQTPFSISGMSPYKSGSPSNKQDGHREPLPSFSALAETRSNSSSISGNGTVLDSDKHSGGAIDDIPKSSAGDEWAVEIENAVFAWSQEESDVKGNELIIPSLRIPKHKFTCVVGRLGSGKTSLLAGAMLGEMSLIRCDLFNLNFPSVAYVSQNPFIFNGTVRSNIVMGAQEDSDRLQACINLACLGPDIEQFSGGLEAELGERGINGSGGQKARIALCRAFYSLIERDVLILDDVFSALDAQVKEQIWTNMKNSELLRGVTIILATHWGEILPQSDLLVPLEDNRVLPSVTFQSLGLNELETFLNVIGVVSLTSASETEDGLQSGSPTSDGDNVQHELEERKAKPVNFKTASIVFNEQNLTQGQLVKKEERAKGHVAFHTVRRLVFRKDLKLWTLITVLLLILNECLVALGPSSWISAWTQDHFSESNGFYAGILFAITAAIYLISEIKGQMFARMMLKGARKVHDDAFQTLMSAKLGFFDTTPMGRVLSRFSADMDIMDVILPEVVETALSLIIRSIFSFLVVAVVFVWFLIPLFVLGGLFVTLFMRFRPSMRMMKRIDATAKSPILSLVESTAHGLTTLRAYGQLRKSKIGARAHYDMMFKTSLAFNATSRYMAVRLDMVTSLSTVVTACFCVLFASEASPGLAGLALTSVLQTGGIFQFALRQLSEAESMFSSVERLVQFSERVPKEREYGAGTLTDELITMQEAEARNFRGEIVFDGVKARYRPRLPLVLNGLSFHVPAGSSCGLVGRTGCGKSSALLALFRIFDVSAGSISVDGIDIGRLPLAFLRSKVLSIIPQDPSLFKGTLRSNLDPFNSFGDAELRSALEQVHLRSYANDLDKSVEEAGGNLSQGERQLFCLARAMLRKTPIVCLDECTSSVDSETSQLIGETLKQLFKNRTLIIVAHRLDVVSSLDQVCVLDAGTCVESGDPRELIASQRGRFFELWQLSQLSGGQ